MAKTSARSRNTTEGMGAGHILSPSQLRQAKEQGAQVKLVATPTPFQQRLLLRKERIIGCVGGVGGGKSYGALMWPFVGNPDQPTHNPDGTPNWTNISYIYNPEYRAMVIRENQVDLAEFLDKFTVFVEAMGGKHVDGEFVFPDKPLELGGVLGRGGRIGYGHLAWKESWAKWRGKNILRLVIEEANLIPKEHFDELAARVRSTYPELRAQILLNANVDGPGWDWIRALFIDAVDEDGNQIPPETTIHVRSINPIDGTTVEYTAVYMFSTITDNPHAIHDPGYIGVLASLPEQKRDAFLLGRYDRFNTQFFPMFREHRKSHEPENARHVFPASDPKVKRETWYPIYMMSDVGYRHEFATYWAFVNEHGQFVVFRELVMKETTLFEVGYNIAKHTYDLIQENPARPIPCYISHDAYTKGGMYKAKIDAVVEGVTKFLKDPTLVHSPYAEMQRLRDAGVLDTEDKLHKYVQYYKEAMATMRGIVFDRAAPDPSTGYAVMQDWFEWKEVGEASGLVFDPLMARQLFNRGDGTYEKYLEATGNSKQVRPRMLIVTKGENEKGDGCPLLVKAIPKAKYHKRDKDSMNMDHFEGLDRLDAVRHGATMIDPKPPVAPWNVELDRRYSKLVESGIAPSNDGGHRYHWEKMQQVPKNYAGDVPQNPMQVLLDDGDSIAAFLGYDED